MPRALRSAQRDKRFSYSALPLPKPLQPPRLPHGVIRGSQSRKVRTNGMGGVASIVSGQSPIVADFSALSGSDFGGHG
jgi:hypothetical protein